MSDPAGGKGDPGMAGHTRATGLTGAKEKTRMIGPTGQKGDTGMVGLTGTTGVTSFKE